MYIILKLDIIWVDTMVAKSWVFQANPNYYDIHAALLKMDKIAWPVTRYINEINIGDNVIIWITGGQISSAGIYAVGTIASKPRLITLNENEKKYWKDNKKFRKNTLMSYVEIKKLIKEPILKSELIKDPILSNLSVIKMRIGTIFRITSEEQKSLNEYFKKAL